MRRPKCERFELAVDDGEASGDAATGFGTGCCGLGATGLALSVLLVNASTLGESKRWEPDGMRIVVKKKKKASSFPIELVGAVAQLGASVLAIACARIRILSQ